jgi:Ice-binding-like/PEP-CTERM motif
MKMRAARKLAIPLLVALAFVPAQAWAVPILGPALKTFAILGAAAVTDVPTSTIFGNVGVYPGSSITGFTLPVPGVPTVDATGQVTGGFLHATTALAAQAQLDLDAAILMLNNMSLFPSTASLGPSLTGLTLTPGNYDLGAGTLTGALILDGDGNPNAVWIFRFTSSFTTSLGSSVSIIDVGVGGGIGVYWNVATKATLDGNDFMGNVLAGTSISSDGGLVIGCGRLLAATADVSLIGDTISIGCGVTAETGYATGGFDQGQNTGSSAVPEPATILLLGLGLAGMFASRKKAFPDA